MGRWLLLLIMIFIPAGLTAGQVTLVTTSFEPYVIEDKEGAGSGMAVEIIKAVAAEAGYVLEIKLLPWNRALSHAARDQNTIILPLSRTPQREALYKWVCIVGPYNVSLYKNASRDDIHFVTLDGAKKYTVGAQARTSRAQWLMDNGFKVELGSVNGVDVTRLKKNRFDLLLYPELVAVYEMRKRGYEEESFTRMLRVDEFSRDGIYAAFSKSTPDNVVKAFRKAFGTLLNQDRYQRIVDRYR